MPTTCPLIFIHIGDTYPEYVVHAIRQARKWNPSVNIYFIAEECYQSKTIDYYSTFVSIEAIHDFIKRERHEGCSFRTQRLLLLEDFMKAYGYHECIHIENDNMIYFDLEYMLPTLREEYAGIAAPYLGKGEISFGMLYVANRNTLSSLNEFLLNMRSTGINEMKLGFQFLLVEGDFLPVVSNECDVCDEDFAYATAHGSAFRGVFDAAAYGQYLGGIDDSKGLQIGYVNKKSAFPADQFEYKSVKFDDGLLFWSAHRHGNSWPLYLLHIDSKYLEMFAS